MQNCKKGMEKICDWLLQQTGLLKILSNSEIILGLEDFLPISYLDIVLLVFKQYVYFCRCKGTIPEFQYFLNRFNNVRDTEKYLVKNGKNVDKYTKKWKELG